MQISSTTASESRDQFLQLLVTQLRHQDPLSPIQQEDMLSQLAQFSSLEGIEKLNRNFEQFLDAQDDERKTQEIAEAAALVGRHVEYAVDPSLLDPADQRTAAARTRSGNVESVLLSDDRIRLQVNGDTVLLRDLIEITDSSSTRVVENVSGRATRQSRSF